MYLIDGLVVLLCCSVLPGRLAMQTLSWPADFSENKNFLNMLLSGDGGHLVISRVNGIYNVNSSDLNQLNQDVTGPYNASTNDIIRVMIYNDTATTGEPVITSCSSTRGYCDIREVADISISRHHLRPPIKIDGVVAMMATYIKPHGGNRRQTFLFIGCPHVKNQQLLDGRCTKPGVFWYLNSGATKNDPWYGFKTYDDTPILTEKYVDAFVVDTFRIFFSLQRVKVSGQQRSRVAQVCQFYSRSLGYTTPFTYADMPLECGDYNVLQTVKKVKLAEKYVFVAVFSGTTRSAVCVYTLENMKRMFASNIKTCYRGSRAGAAEDYINFQTSHVPCSRKTTETLQEPDEFFLCNKDRLESFHHVIGNQSLHSDPVVQYNTQLTAVTVAVEDSKVVAFLGTTNGDILKAVVHPQTSAVEVKQPRIHNVGYGIKKDMHTSKDQRHIFVLTQRQVIKEPVERCSEFSDCEYCLGSRDPYCGWCFQHNRCSRRDNCTDSEWISASGDGKCPHVVSIEPEVMSDKEILQLQMEVSQSLRGVGVSCEFSSDGIDDLRDIVAARVSENGTKLACRPRDILHIVNRINGYLTITVSIVTNVSIAPVMDSQFIMYRCETFDRCISCTARNWTCKWCTYSNQCMDSDRQCEASDNSVAYGDCPKVTSFTMLPDNSSIRDSSKIVYLSQDKEYKINITGTNLPTPRETMAYRCKIVVSKTKTLWFEAVFNNAGGSFQCLIRKDDLLTIGTLDRQEARVQVTWGDTLIGGLTLQVIIYKCGNLVQPTSNCGQCKSFVKYQPHLHCHWCETECIDREIQCNGTTVCGDPEIVRVYPLSAYMNATTRVEIEGSNLGSSWTDTINAVTIAGIPCVSTELAYEPGVRIECELSPSHEEIDGTVDIILSTNGTGQYSKRFYFRNPVVTLIEPNLGPQSGGTNVTIYGEDLDTGREKRVYIGGKLCRLVNQRTVYKMVDRYNDSHVRLEKGPTKLVCLTASCDTGNLDKRLDVRVDFDEAGVTVEENTTYKYVVDPNITAIFPKKSFQSGGRRLTIEGTNLYSIQTPMIYAVIGGKRTKSRTCERNDTLGVIYCRSPAYEGEDTRRKRSVDPVQAKLGFEMDAVSSVTADSLSSNLGVLMYFPDPILENFTEVKLYKELQEHLVITGQRLNVAATEEDVQIVIGCESCNITSMTSSAIICKPPEQKPSCNEAISHKLTVQVNIGFLQRNVGFLEYEGSHKPEDLNGVTKTEYIIAGSVVGVLVLCLLAASIVVFVMWRKRKDMKKQKVGLEYKMDKLEAKFRNQCREEFAALQTAVSDLTSDLEGGNVLFREYDVYASKTLSTSQRLDVLMTPPTATEQSQQALETFKGLLRNRQFLLMLIGILEKQNSFTIHDKSNVATALMVLNHDNMEYITGILTTLLNDLIDKNITSGTPKLLLRRSECVAEKLLTHWLSICLYHFLKERSGSALYILYKAIKIQTEKGPIDYISNCGKYTLSEDRLFTSADTEINPVTMTLEVKHFDYIDNIEKQISVQVLDCDTITQAKNKMLEILYKNVPYSQRPAVHVTSLEIEEGDGGTKRLLNDEDASSVKEGIWKRINTLQHYSVTDGAKVNLYLDREMEASCNVLAGASPDSYIVGSFRRSKPVVRTISGSNFWHLTKKHQTEDEVQLTSDLFLPRLLNTKGTLQKYIDDLFQAVLCVEEEPPLIVKYLFDFLDNAASRCGITDPDVLHTWKCNSLLLRFWVNILKNPEFVFDIHKPHIVDSCLSVVAQTLMDSCSTADLVLGPSSPSNKLLFAKDIPRYKTMVRQYFQDINQKPAVSDQELNSYLTQKVSQKFSGKFNQSAAVLEMYGYTNRYRNKVCNEMDNLEASSPGSFSPLTSKLQYVFMCMDMYAK